VSDDTPPWRQLTHDLLRDGAGTRRRELEDALRDIERGLHDSHEETFAAEPRLGGWGDRQSSVPSSDS
jgi:hypothetical protein